MRWWDVFDGLGNLLRFGSETSLGMLFSLLGIVVSGLTLVVVCVTARANIKAAQGTERSAKAEESSAETALEAAEISVMATILTTIPLVTPTVDVRGGTATVTLYNWGKSTAHNIFWRVHEEGNEPTSWVQEKQGSNQLLEPNGDHRLLDVSADNQLIVDAVNARNEGKTLVVNLKWSASWGEEFMSKRRYPEGSRSPIEITNDAGIPLRLDPRIKAKPPTSSQTRS